MNFLTKSAILLFAGVLEIAPGGFAQAPSPSPAAAVWNALSAPAMDPGKSAHAENVEIIRDRVHITLTDGTIEFTQPVDGVAFGAVFHGRGRVQVDPPNPAEAQQLRLFTKQDRLDFPFSDATTSGSRKDLQNFLEIFTWSTART